MRSIFGQTYRCVNSEGVFSQLLEFLYQSQSQTRQIYSLGYRPLVVMLVLICQRSSRHDMGLKTCRTRNPIAEFMAPFNPLIYKGLTQELQALYPTKKALKTLVNRVEA